VTLATTVVATDANALAALVIAITGLVAAIAAVLGIFLTHKKVGAVGIQLMAIKKDTETIKNGGVPSDGPTNTPGSG
jgi:hypothetical protein